MRTDVPPRDDDMKTLNLSRRHALTMFGALGALALPPVGASSSSRTSSGGSAKPLHELSVREALIGLARRDFSASEYVQDRKSTV